MKTRKPRIVLIDDDPSFTGVMAHVATKNGLIAESFNTLEEIDQDALEKADVVVLDYDLGGRTTGIAIGTWLERLKFKKPVLLVSADTRAFTHGQWPSTIRNFATKSLGPFGVLKSIRELTPA